MVARRAILLLSVLCLLSAGCDYLPDWLYPWGPSGSDTGSTLGMVTVTKIVDGDTIWVEDNGAEYKVRYIGVDTPETYGGVECYGQEAKEANTRLVSGKSVYLELDVEAYDRYDRVLAYVWATEDRTDLTNMVNYVLVLFGYATVATYPPNVKYVDDFVAAQRYVAENSLGLWKECE